MTSPIPPVNSALELPSVVSAGVRGLVDNASRLGLTWDMRLGTVKAYNSGTNIADVILDGDSEAVAVKTLSGPVNQTQRVYVVKVPPGGYYLVGYVGAPPRIGVRLGRINNQSIANNSIVAIQWDTEYQDTENFWVSTNNTVVRIPAGKGGIYGITATAVSAGSAGAARKLVNIGLTSTLPGLNNSNYRGNGGTGESDVTATTITPLAAGDSFTVILFHNTGSPQNWTALLSCFRLGS